MKKLLLILAFLLLPGLVKAQLSMADSGGNYVITNTGIYVVSISHTLNSSLGMAVSLQVYTAAAALSDNLLCITCQSSAGHGLGWLEGDNTATINDGIGMTRIPGSGSSGSVTVLMNTSALIVLEATVTTNYNLYKQVWTFWSGQPYFRAYASATRTDAGALVNQFQFCNMVNNSGTAGTYTTWQTDATTGAATQITAGGQQSLRPITSASKYPWFNEEFTTETVALGWIITDTNEGTLVGAITGDWPYEWQANWDGGISGGTQTNPVKQGNTRMLTTYYETSNAASNTAIDALASSLYAQANKTVINQAAYQAAFNVDQPYNQATGAGSAILNAPYFLIRQNGQIGYGAKPQYQTGIYAPLWTLPIMDIAGQNLWTYGSQWPQKTNTAYEGYIEPLDFVMEYDNNTTTYVPGALTPSSATNGTTTSIIHTASSTDNNLTYTSTLTTWNDSDKVEITGAATPGSACSTNCLVKDIWMDFEIPYTTGLANTSGFGNYVYWAVNGLPAGNIVGTLIPNDNKFSNYAYGFSWDGIGAHSAVYYDNAETVYGDYEYMPVNLPSGSYRVIAGNRRISGVTTTYSYSSDGSAYTQFAIPTGTTGAIDTSLGSVYINGKFYFSDDNNAAQASANYAAWTYAVITPQIVTIDSTHYDVEWVDPLYGQQGIGVILNVAVAGVVLVAPFELKIQLYTNASQQTLSAFSYAYDVTLWPHSGFLTSAGQFTGLHTQAPTSFTRVVPNGTSALAFGAM